jgi:dTMP kinase
MFRFMERGNLIVIEGTDGSGKNTQAVRLSERLIDDGLNCEMLSFPGYGSPTGDIVGDCYLGKNKRIKTGSWFKNADQLDPKIACAYYAADRRAALPVINRILGTGGLLVLDRYIPSNQGHQCGKIDDFRKREIMRDWIERLEYDMFEMPRPDYIIFLHMPYSISLELREIRGEKPDAHESSEEHLRNAERSYIELAKHYGWKRINCSFDGKNPRSVDDIHEEIFGHISGLLK